MEQSVKFKWGIRIWFCAFEILAIAIILSLIFDKNEFSTETICAITLIAILALLGLVYTFYLFSYKIVVRGEEFSVRKFIITQTFKTEDITSVDYKRKAFGDYTYVIKIGKKKVEVSLLLKDKIVIDKFFEEKGIFRKFPRVNY